MSFGKFTRQEIIDLISGSWSPYWGGTGGGGGSGTPGAPLNSIQFNSGSAFSGSNSFTYIPTNSSLYYTGSFFVQGAISASNGANTIGFFGTSSRAVTSSLALNADNVLVNNIGSADEFEVLFAKTPGAYNAINSSGNKFTFIPDGNPVLKLKALDVARQATFNLGDPNTVAAGGNRLNVSGSVNIYRAGATGEDNLLVLSSSGGPIMYVKDPYYGIVNVLNVYPGRLFYNTTNPNAFTIGNSGEIYMPQVNDSNQQHVMMFNTASGQLTYLTASYFDGNPFPFTGSAIITGSLIVTGSVNVSAGITGSLFGTASWATRAVTASVVEVQRAGNIATFYPTFVDSNNSAPLAEFLYSETTFQLAVNPGVATALTVTSITSSLFGTASYVTGSIFTSGNPALSASYATTASFTTAANTVSVIRNSVNATLFPVFVDSNNNPAGYESLYTENTLTFNPNRGALTATSLTGSLFGTASYVTGALFTSANPALSASYALSSSYASYASYALTSSAGGSNTQIQFNSASILSGDTSFTYNYQLQSVQQNGSQGTGQGSHAEGASTIAYGPYSHAEGVSTQAKGNYSHAEGWYSEVGPDGIAAHAEGYNTRANGYYSHAEGTSRLILYTINFDSLTQIDFDFSGGPFSVVSSTYGGYSNTIVVQNDITGLIPSIPYTTTTFTINDGVNTIVVSTPPYTMPTIQSATFDPFVNQTTLSVTDVYSTYDEIQNNTTIAAGYGSHAEGFGTRANGVASHAEGYLTSASGSYSHTAGIGTIASGSGQNVVGKYNLHDNTTSLFVIGDGASDTSRRDLLRAESGAIQITGSLSISGSDTVAPLIITATSMPPVVAGGIYFDGTDFHLGFA